MWGQSNRASGTRVPGWWAERGKSVIYYGNVPPSHSILGRLGGWVWRGPKKKKKKKKTSQSYLRDRDCEFGLVGEEGA